MSLKLPFKSSSQSVRSLSGQTSPVFGRRAKSPTMIGSIQSVRWGAGTNKDNYSYQVTDNLKNQCNDKKECDVTIGVQFFGPDPAPNQKKTATYTWTCGDRKKYGGNADDGATVHLQCW
jgi:hypothetical protein